MQQSAAATDPLDTTISEARLRAWCCAGLLQRVLGPRHAHRALVLLFHRGVPQQLLRLLRARLHVTHVIRDHATGQVVIHDGELSRLNYHCPSEFVADELAAAVETEAEHCL